MSATDHIDFGRAPFEFIPGDRYYTIQLAGDLDLDSAREFDKRLSKKIPEIKNHLLLDLTHCKGMHPQWFRILMGLVSHCRNSQKKLRCFGMSDRLRFYLAENGMDSTLQNFQSKELAIADL